MAHERQPDCRARVYRGFLPKRDSCSPQQVALLTDSLVDDERVVQCIAHHTPHRHDLGRYDTTPRKTPKPPRAYWKASPRPGSPWPTCRPNFPAQQEDYDRPTIAIEWTRRPPYAATARSTVSPDKRRTLRWTDVYMGPVTFQILDRAAFRSAVEVLQLAHNTAVAVCLSARHHVEWEVGAGRRVANAFATVRIRH